MNNNIVSLRTYINSINNINSEVKVKTFCRLMKKVCDAIDKEERNIIRINLDEIEINIVTGDIILPDNLFSNDDSMDKTIAGFNTGISLMADRKSTKENKRVSLALMILGWYYNPNGNAITSDIDVLDNFDLYLSKVPNWLHDYFINIFKKMDYETSFSEYYNNKFTKEITKQIKDSFAMYNLNDEQLKKITKILMKKTNKDIKAGELDEQNV